MVDTHLPRTKCDSHKEGRRKSRNRKGKTGERGEVNMEKTIRDSTWKKEFLESTSV
jgi:hypothetical protein